MPPIVNRYTRLVGIDHPIVQEGLGPFRTPRPAAAVSNAGGLGTVSMPSLRNAASEELLASRRPGDTSWKIELMQRAQADGDVTNGLVLTGQVASAIGDIISVAEFVPQMAEEAAAVLRSLCVLVGDGPAEKPRTSCS